jgi:RNA polymerase sigma-70 factor (ECF subfamily)
MATLDARRREEHLNEPDPRTLRRAREGDAAAFEDLVRTYQVDVWRFATRFTHDRVLAEDVAQETFLRAFRFLRTYRGESRFTTWLLRIARNCAIDAMRRNTAVADHDPADTPVAAVAEHRTEIDAALAALGSRHREPFLLIEVFGLSYEEASEVLGVRVGTLKSRMHRARQAMIRALAEEQEVSGGA